MPTSRRAAASASPARFFDLAVDGGVVALVGARLGDRAGGLHPHDDSADVVGHQVVQFPGQLQAFLAADAVQRVALPVVGRAQDEPDADAGSPVRGGGHREQRSGDPDAVPEQRRGDHHHAQYRCERGRLPWREPPSGRRGEHAGRHDLGDRRLHPGMPGDLRHGGDHRHRGDQAPKHPHMAGEAPPQHGQHRDRHPGGRQEPRQRRGPAVVHLGRPQRQQEIGDDPRGQRRDFGAQRAAPGPGSRSAHGRHDPPAGVRPRAGPRRCSGWTAAGS
jgi:hypothetical protein